MEARILVVEPDPAGEGRWRFGRVTDPGEALEEGVGVLEEREGTFHLISGGGDAITAHLLVRDCNGPARRLVYEPPSPVSPRPLAAGAERTVLARPMRAARSTGGLSKGGGGETLAERAEGLRRQR